MLLGFTVVFPTAKLIIGLVLWFCVDTQSRRLHVALGWLEVLGKWSMLDVFVVALLVISVKASFIADVSLDIGLYLFVAVVLLSGVALHRIGRVAQTLLAGD